ncbi:hypothetical protein QBC47DRAFT_392274 [Echria macrotheca]|uniref:FAD/NAD(P)-binding domain-containing protein n=1 Tax=Echria macrotheca TaxID=438768 RepID=A0AAJ0F1E4_9PEZI|nr:hypothetical protein QBC47DRAFT_392274 [Echria macrotheca]
MSDGPGSQNSVAPDGSSEQADVHDVIIIGAGPCGLAVAARLREQAPAPIFTDEEHRRYWWLRKHKRWIATKHVKDGRVSCRPQVPVPELDVVVLDADNDQWLSRWDRLFTMYDIQHLRSPMFWHMDPGERDSLLAFAHETERVDELVEIRHCVGKELSKHARKKRQGRRGGDIEPREINERERTDYFNPSRSLFSEHARSVASRYGLINGLVQKESVLDIQFGVVDAVSTGGEPLFTVDSNKGRRYAKVVVLAVGPANKPTIPAIPTTCPSATPADTKPRQMCHSMHIEHFPDPIIQKKINAGQQTTVLVVGGGLTSSQLSDLAVRRGVTTVWHIMRGPFRVKPFDLDLEWMSKYRNVQQAMFWSADSDEERLQMIKAARGGGSMTPTFSKRLHAHVSSGRVKLRTNTAIVGLDYMYRGCGRENKSPGSGSWIVTTDPPIPDLPPMDYIYFATGVQSDFSTLGYLQTMMASNPIQGFGGFPCLNDDLMWKDGVPLFVTGKLAALRLGPGAANLGGAMVGAERIALALMELLSSRRRRGETPKGSQPHAKRGNGLFSYNVGLGSKYHCLGQEEVV